MKFSSLVYAQASGSIGGITYSHNRGGMYTRTRTTPVNPNTARQLEARANLAQASSAWSTLLTDTNRQAWTTYANGTPVVNALGAQLILTGQQMFNKCMLPRLIAGLALIPAGPLITGLATTPTFTVDPALEVGVDFEETVAVSGSGVTGDLLTYISEPTSPSRSLAQAKRAFAQLQGPPVAGVFTVSFPAASLPYDYTAGQAGRVTVVYLGDDGRPSAEASRDFIAT